MSYIVENTVSLGQTPWNEVHNDQTKLSQCNPSIPLADFNSFVFICFAFILHGSYPITAFCTVC